MSYATQMLGLAVQNFVSAASGIAVLIALIRGIRARGADAIGNFWVDLVRSTLHVLLPLSLVLALVLVSQGVVQNFSAYQTVPLLQATTATTPVTDAGGNPVLDEQAAEDQTTAVSEQLLPMGPAASQVAIKQLGTNGGGFFNVNSAHPFENPTPLSNFLEVISILLISAALCATFGVMVGDRRQGVAAARRDDRRLHRAALAVLRGRAGAAIRASPRSASTRRRARSSRAATWRARRSASASPAPRTGRPRRPPPRTARSTAMHDSFTPLGGLVPLFMIQLGEVIYGGVGSGLYGMIAFVLIAVFVAGLMVGRTPEYLGKKIEAFEMKMASLMILIPPALVLLFTAIASCLRTALASRRTPGAHGFSRDPLRLLARWPTTTAARSPASPPTCRSTT